MKKIALTFIILIALLSLTTGSALAANGILTLRSVGNNPGGGVLFVFEYTGDFTEGDFKNGSVLFNGQYYPLDCNIVEGEGVVQCTASRALAGQFVQVFLAGFVFWDRVPEGGGRGFGGSSQNCYEVWYWDFGNDSIDWFQDALPHCQDAPANYGDVIFLTAPPYTYTDFYYFWDDNQTDNPGSGGCGDFVFDGSVTGDAYYEQCSGT